MDDMTRGQQLVGFNFNPSGDEKVAKVKQLCADLIDMLIDITPDSAAQRELADTAVKEVITAQMWAVKALTWKGDLV